MLVTGAGTYENLSEAVARGADGFVMKPFSHAELQRAVAAAIERARRAEQDLRERLLAPTLAAALGNAIETRDSGMEGHCERLSALAIRLGGCLRLPREELEQIRLGAVLHDIGKIGIPDSVLLKAGPLAPDELAHMRTHTVIGDRLLAPLELLAGVRPIVRHHHERWDGQGYPDGLAGEEIPLSARIVALADSIEAMSAHRVYRSALGREAIVCELEAGRGKQWDPALVDLARQLIGSGQLSFDENGLELLPHEEAAERPSIQSVLLVEQDSAHAKVAAAALEQAFADVRVVRADSIARGVELFRSSGWTLAIVGQFLPDGSGFDFLDAVQGARARAPRADAHGRGLRIGRRRGGPPRCDRLRRQGQRLRRLAHRPGAGVAGGGMIRVVIADDHPAVRMSFEAYLDAQDGIEVVGAVQNGREAVALAQSHEPDVVVMDVRMPLVDGIEATRQIKRLVPGTRVILISAYEEQELRDSGQQAGADQFLFKGIMGSRLADYVRKVAA